MLLACLRVCCAGVCALACTHAHGCGIWPPASAHARTHAHTHTHTHTHTQVPKALSSSLGCVLTAVASLWFVSFSVHTLWNAHLQPELACLPACLQRESSPERALSSGSLDLSNSLRHCPVPVSPQGRASGVARPDYFAAAQVRHRYPLNTVIDSSVKSSGRCTLCIDCL